ncbi:MAG: hypothetical protein ACREXX_14520, partial [Gammaproteobacteria bacterium]
SSAVGLVEGALAKAIPVAIGFLAGLLGLGDPTAPVRSTIEKARSPVEKAIDWVIRLAVKGVKAAGKLVGGLFGGKKDKGKKGEEPAGEHGPRREGDGEVGKTVTFSAAGEGHRLWINVQGTSVKVMLATSPEEVTAKLNDWQGRMETVPEEKRAEARRLLAAARQALGDTQGDAQRAEQKKEQAEHEPADLQAGQEFSQADDKTEAAEQGLADILAQLYEIFGEREEVEPSSGYEHVPIPNFESEEDAVDHAGKNNGGFAQGSTNPRWEATGEEEYINGPQRRAFLETKAGRVQILEWWCDKEGKEKRYTWVRVAFEEARTHKGSLTPIKMEQRRAREERGARRDEQRQRREKFGREKGKGRGGRGKRFGPDTDE